MRDVAKTRKRFLSVMAERMKPTNINAALGFWLFRFKRTIDISHDATAREMRAAMSGTVDFAFPAPRSSLWRGTDHRIVELLHERAFIWSGVISEGFRLLDDDLFRIGGQ